MLSGRDPDEQPARRRRFAFAAEPSDIPALVAPAPAAPASKRGRRERREARGAALAPPATGSPGSG
eukprot:11629961-Alexandrium_andersonii.AAC.1